MRQWHLLMPSFVLYPLSCQENTDLFILVFTKKEGRCMRRSIDVGEAIQVKLFKLMENTHDKGMPSFWFVIICTYMQFYRFKIYSVINLRYIVGSFLDNLKFYINSSNNCVIVTYTYIHVFSSIYSTIENKISHRKFKILTNYYQLFVGYLHALTFLHLPTPLTFIQTWSH